jgi:hypothetical protein
MHQLLNSDIEETYRNLYKQSNIPEHFRDTFVNNSHVPS